MNRCCISTRAASDLGLHGGNLDYHRIVIEYDIAEIVDPRPHVVAKLRKDVLAQISEP
jgi:hypothetical protein